MAHCEICDFSETVRSDFYTSLHGVDPQGNKVVYDDKTDKFLCVDCIGASLANYRSLGGLDPHEPGEVTHALDNEEVEIDVGILADSTPS